MKTLQTPVISTQKRFARQFWWCSDKNSGLSPILALVVDIRPAPLSLFFVEEVLNLTSSTTSSSAYYVKTFLGFCISARLQLPTGKPNQPPRNHFLNPLVLLLYWSPVLIWLRQAFTNGGTRCSLPMENSSVVRAALHVDESKLFT